MPDEQLNKKNSEESDNDIGAESVVASRGGDNIADIIDFEEFEVNSIDGDAEDGDSVDAHGISQLSDFEEIEEENKLRKAIKEKKLKQVVELIDGLNALFYQKTEGPEKNEKGQDSQRQDYIRSYFKAKAGSPVKIDGNDYFRLEVKSEDGPYFFHVEEDVYVEIFTKISENHESFYCALKTNTYVRMLGVVWAEYESLETEENEGLMIFYKTFSTDIESKMDEYFLNKILEMCSVNDGQIRFFSLDMFIDNFYEIVVNDLLGFISEVLLEYLVGEKTSYKGKNLNFGEMTRDGFFDDEKKNIKFFNVFLGFISFQDLVIRSYVSSLSCGEKNFSEKDKNDFREDVQEIMKLKDDFFENCHSDEKSFESSRELKVELNGILTTQLDKLLSTGNMNTSRRSSGVSLPDCKPGSPTKFFKFNHLSLRINDLICFIFHFFPHNLADNLALVWFSPSDHRQRVLTYCVIAAPEHLPFVHQYKHCIPKLYSSNDLDYKFYFDGLKKTPVT